MVRIAISWTGYERMISKSHSRIPACLDALGEKIVFTRALVEGTTTKIQNSYLY